MKSYYLYILLSLYITGSSCKKLVEVEIPKNQLTTETVYQYNETATSAMLAIYPLMMEGNASAYRISLYTGLYVDELKSFSNLPALQVIYSNALRPIDAQTNDIWTLAYNYIYLANGVYEGCNNSSNLSPAIKKQLMAEAIFVRAFWHFYLLNLYGDIPIVRSTDYTENAIAKRSPVQDVYNQIVSDLMYAEENLNENYVASNSTTVTSDRIRPNRYTATALLARVYLYQQRYAEAEQKCTVIINNRIAYDLTRCDSVFLKNSKEAIWQLAKALPNTLNINTTEGNGYVLTGKPISSNISSTAISAQLMGTFETGDLRQVNWIGKYTDATITPNIDYYFPYKYKVKTGSTITEQSTVFRLGEIYLIRAEARTQQGEIQKAIDDVDVIRKRAGLTLVKNTNPSILKAPLLELIYHERVAELFTEFGHRFFDLKRTNKINDLMTTLAPLKGGVWTAGKQFWPLPQLEIQNDPNLEQNSAYK
jgi:hypothetical protein